MIGAEKIQKNLQLDAQMTAYLRSERETRERKVLIKTPQSDVCIVILLAGFISSSHQ